MNVTEPGLFVTLICARHEESGAAEVIDYLARSKAEGGLALVQLFPQQSYFPGNYLPS